MVLTARLYPFWRELYGGFEPPGWVKTGLKRAAPLQPKNKYLLSAHGDDRALLTVGDLYHVENIGGRIDFPKTLWDSKKNSIEVSWKL